MYTALNPHKVISMNDDETTLRAVCDCGREGTVEVRTNDYHDWGHYGVAVQTAFPYVSPECREWFFMSGICPECWNTYWSFGEEDDEE